MLLALALTSIVPAIGAVVLRRTYRTDRFLRSLPVPKPSPSAYFGASATALAVIVAGPVAGLPSLAAFVVGPLLGMAFLTDAAGRVLPDLLTGALAIAGMLLAYFGAALSIQAAAAGMIGWGIGLGIFRALLTHTHGSDAFGLGDVKFVAASAAVIPIPQIAWAFVLAAPLALGLIAVRRLRCDPDPEVPFGSLFAAGLALAIVGSAVHAWF